MATTEKYVGQNIAIVTKSKHGRDVCLLTASNIKHFFFPQTKTKMQMQINLWFVCWSLLGDISR